MMRKISVLLVVLIGFATVQALNGQEHSARNVTMLSTLAPRGVGAYYTDIWGYVDGEGREYAIFGQRNGTCFVDVTDPENPVSVGFIEGPSSGWRDIKTWGHYAYIVHDANDNAYPRPGLQIVDLSPMPANPPELVNTYNENMFPGTAHNIGLTDGIAYLVGNKAYPGVIVLDVRQDPVHPVEIYNLREPYWHDVIVHNDVLFASAIYDGFIHILDNTNPSAPVEISRTKYPGAFTHNIAHTDDNRYIISTDEIHGRPLNFWDVSDLSSPEWRAAYKMDWPSSVAHNAYIRGEYAYIAYYFDGLKILDISDRNAPVEVGHFDTYPDDEFEPQTGFNGAWGSYPYLPSGNILVSDIKYGLFVLRFNDTKAGYIKGRVYDAESNEVLPQVDITMLNRPVWEGVTTVQSAADGSYAVGSQGGTRKLRFYLYGYEELIIDSVEFSEGATLNRDVFLKPHPRAGLLVNVRTTDGELLPGLSVDIASNVYNYAIQPQADANSEIRRTLIYDSYTLNVKQWGFLPFSQGFEINSPGLTEIDVVLQRAYFEDFLQPEQWELSDMDSTNRWFTIQAYKQDLFEILPTRDPARNTYGYYVYSKAQRGSAVLTSRSFDATKIATPVLEFYRFFNPRQYLNDSAADDSLYVYVSNDNGASWTLMDSYTAIDNDWVKVQYWLEEYITPGATMKIRFVHTEGDRDNRTSIRYRRPSYCALDDFVIKPDRITDVEDPETESGGAYHAGTILYPNPAEEALHLRLQAARPVVLRIALSDALGRTLRQMEYPAFAGERHIELSLSGLPPGSYYVRVHRGTETEVHALQIVR